MLNSSAGKAPNPDAAWEAFQAHIALCPFCTVNGECPEGAALLKAWGQEDHRAALEQEAIDNAQDCAPEGYFQQETRNATQEG